MEYTNKCNHVFKRLGFEAVKSTKTYYEAIGALFCPKCGLFRTKVLTFRRELRENEKNGRKSDYAD